jgi:hypothetical protein
LLTEPASVKAQPSPPKSPNSLSPRLLESQPQSSLLSGLNNSDSTSPLNQQLQQQQNANTASGLSSSDPQPSSLPLGALKAIESGQAGGKSSFALRSNQPGRVPISGKENFQFLTKQRTLRNVTCSKCAESYTDDNKFCPVCPHFILFLFFFSCLYPFYFSFMFIFSILIILLFIYLFIYFILYFLFIFIILLFF